MDRHRQDHLTRGSHLAGLLRPTLLLSARYERLWATGADTRFRGARAQKVPRKTLGVDEQRRSEPMSSSVLCANTSRVALPPDELRR